MPLRWSEMLSALGWPFGDGLLGLKEVDFRGTMFCEIRSWWCTLLPVSKKRKDHKTLLDETKQETLAGSSVFQRNPLGRIVSNPGAFAWQK
jgi:hypothetical protein